MSADAIIVPDHDDTRSDGPMTGGEREILDHWVELYRASVLLKVAGLTGEQLCARSVPPSSMSLLGAVRHLTEVEAYWLREVLAGEEVPDIHSARENPDGDWLDASAEWAADDVERYRAEVELARASAARHALDDVAAAQRHGRPVTLRWILTHLIEEYARHLGHMDLLREAVDGRTGY